MGVTLPNKERINKKNTYVYFISNISNDFKKLIYFKKTELSKTKPLYILKTIQYAIMQITMIDNKRKCMQM